MLTSRDLHVITVHFNPGRYRTRVELYNRFSQYMADSDVTFWTVEIALGDRPFEVTDAANPRHLQLRTWDEFWVKENAANKMLERLPQDWQYVALVDADITFSRPSTGPFSWVSETLHQLQRYMVVQMWQEAVDLGPDFQIIQRHESFFYRYCNGLAVQTKVNDPYNAFGHPGYAWAYRRDAVEQLGTGMSGPFLDTAICGAADHHMALAFVGRAEATVPGNINQAYKDEVFRWQTNALKLNKDIGYVATGLSHWWHGSKASRRYVERWSILIDNNFTPYTDLRRDWQGIYALNQNKPKLRDDLRAYFGQRDEDSNFYEAPNASKRVS
jgi:hypothetical protein